MRSPFDSHDRTARATGVVSYLRISGLTSMLVDTQLHDREPRRQAGAGAAVDDVQTPCRAGAEVKAKSAHEVAGLRSDWGGIRTHDLRVMSPALSPTELPSRSITASVQGSRPRTATRPSAYILVWIDIRPSVTRRC